MRRQSALENARVGGRGLRIFPRHGLLIFRRGAFQLLLIETRGPLQVAQPHVIGVGGANHGLLLFQRPRQILDPGAGDMGVVFQRARDALGGGAALRIEILKLRLQLLYARVTREQRAGLERELSAQGHALLLQSANHLVIGDIGNVADPVLPQHVAQQSRFRLGVRLRGARQR